MLFLEYEVEEMGGGFVEEILGIAGVFGEFLELSIPIARFSTVTISVTLIRRGQDLVSLTSFVDFGC